MAAGLRSFAWTMFLALLGAAPVFGQSQTPLPPIKTVDYDQRGASRAILQAGLHPHLAERLTYGL